LERVLDDVDRILTTSPRLSESSSFLAAYQGTTSIVPLSVDVGELRSRSAAVPFPTDGSTVLFVGRLNYYKGVKYLIQAMSRTESDAQLVLVGDGKRRAELERTARAESIEDDVQFLGVVSDDVLGACYDAADVFVLPSVEPSEAFGIVQLEAMAHGVPVVNTSLPTGVPWVSVDGLSGLTVPPREPEPLAAAIDQLVSSPELRETYGRNARERVETKFTTDRMISDTLDVYRELLE